MYIFLALFFAFLSASEVPGQPYFNRDGALVLPSNDFENFTADPELKKARATYLYDKFLNDPQWHNKFVLQMYRYMNIFVKQYSATPDQYRSMFKEHVISVYPTALFMNCMNPECLYIHPKIQRNFIERSCRVLADFISKPTDRPLHLVFYASGGMETEGRILLQTFQNPSLMQLPKNLIVHCIDPVYKSIEKGGFVGNDFMRSCFKKLLKEGKPTESKLKIKGVSFNTSVAEFLKLLAASSEDGNRDKEHYINPSLLVFGIDFDKDVFLKTGSVTDLQKLLKRYEDASVVLALEPEPKEIVIIEDRPSALAVLQQRQNSLSK
jgi:hypothetical protein